MLYSRLVDRNGIERSVLQLRSNITQHTQLMVKCVNDIASFDLLCVRNCVLLQYQSHSIH